MKPSISHWLEKEPSTSLQRAERKSAFLEQLVARMLCDFTTLELPYRVDFPDLWDLLEEQRESLTSQPATCRDSWTLVSST